MRRATQLENNVSKVPYLMAKKGSSGLTWRYVVSQSLQCRVLACLASSLTGKGGGMQPMIASLPDPVKMRLHQVR